MHRRNGVVSRQLVGEVLDVQASVPVRLAVPERNDAAAFGDAAIEETLIAGVRPYK